MPKRPMRDVLVVLGARKNAWRKSVKQPQKRYFIKPERDFVDFLQILVPAGIAAAIAYAGQQYTHNKDVADQRSRQWDRVASYMKLLTSSNDQERAYGLRIIEALEKGNNFPGELLPEVQALAQGRPSDPNTQTAARIAASQSTPTPRRPRQSSPSAPAMSSSPTAVFVQYAGEAQRCEAELSGNCFARDRLRGVGPRDGLPSAGCHNRALLFASFSA